MEKTIDKIEYRFENPHWDNVWRVHPSMQSNSEFQRMEFFGDKIISFYITKIIVSRNKDIEEGQLSINLSNMINSKQMGALGSFLKNEIQANEEINSKIVSDCLEAFIGCIFMDGGNVEEVIEKIWHDLLDKDFEKNAKNLLQEWAEKRGKNPVYVFQKQKDGFSCSISMDDILCSYTAESKKSASLKCAEIMVNKLNISSSLPEHKSENSEEIDVRKKSRVRTRSISTTEIEDIDENFNKKNESRLKMKSHFNKSSFDDAPIYQDSTFESKTVLKKFKPHSDRNHQEGMQFNEEEKRRPFRSTSDYQGDRQFSRESSYTGEIRRGRPPTRSGTSSYQSRGRPNYSRGSQDGRSFNRSGTSSYQGRGRPNYSRGSQDGRSFNRGEERRPSDRQSTLSQRPSYTGEIRRGRPPTRSNTNSYQSRGRPNYSRGSQDGRSFNRGEERRPFSRPRAYSQQRSSESTSNRQSDENNENIDRKVDTKEEKDDFEKKHAFKGIKTKSSNIRRSYKNSESQRNKPKETQDKR